MVAYNIFDELMFGEVFADMCNAILVAEISPHVRPFSSLGADGGRDAVFEGRSAYAPTWSGTWVFQHKFVHVGGQGIKKARQKIKSLLPKEIDKVLGGPGASPDNYIFITNVIFSGAAKSGLHDWFLDDLVPRFKGKGMKHIDYWEGGKVLALLQKHHLTRQYLGHLGPGEFHQLLEQISQSISRLEQKTRDSGTFSEENWCRVVESCFERSRKEISQRISKKYIPKLYVPRRLDRLFELFLDAGEQCFLVVDKAGSGKTNLLCNLALAHGREAPVVFLPGKIPLTSPGALLREVNRRLGFENDSQLKSFEDYAARNSFCVLIFIDGVNENDKRDYMKEGLIRLLLEGRGRGLQVYCFLP